jgi:hypothetical protein
MQELHARQYLRRVSLDRILCDPSLATEFDSLAQRIAPGYSSLEYRWAAFTIRKLRRPYIGSPRISFEHMGNTFGVRVSRLPNTGGLYRFLSGTRELYVGETSNIRQQIEIHLDNNGTAIFPDWMEARVHEPIELLVAQLPDNPSAKERGRLKTFYTDRFMPHFNWLGAGIIAA